MKAALDNLERQHGDEELERARCVVVVGEDGWVLVGRRGRNDDAWAFEHHLNGAVDSDYVTGRAHEAIVDALSDAYWVKRERGEIPDPLARLR